MVKIYKISIHIANSRTLTYTVNDYEMLDGGLIKFYDSKFNKVKIFDARLCEIEVNQSE